jgi:hypothetical protein
MQNYTFNVDNEHSGKTIHLKAICYHPSPEGHQIEFTSNICKLRDEVFEISAIASYDYSYDENLNTQASLVVTNETPQDYDLDYWTVDSVLDVDTNKWYNWNDGKIPAGKKLKIVVYGHDIAQGARSLPATCELITAVDPPSIPVITRSPTGNNILLSQPITITAGESICPAGGDIQYEWRGRIGPGANLYPKGKIIVQCRAKSLLTGLYSTPATVMFFVTDSTSGGMLLVSPESRIVEEGFPGGIIVAYTFTVPSVSGHSGNDYAWIKGYNSQTGNWDQLQYQTTRNGITLSGTIDSLVYTKLEMFYYAAHCMYGKSNITYSCDFILDENAVDDPTLGEWEVQG